MGSAPSLPNPTIVTVHGAWHQPIHFAHLSSTLVSRGYDVVTPLLPSCNYTTGSERHDVSVLDDAAYLRDEVLAPLLDEEKNVVLVVHSYGGLPGSEASWDLGVKERRSRGLLGGIVRLVYMTAIMHPEGVPLIALTNGTVPPIFNVLPDNRYIVPASSAHIFCHDCPPANIVEATKHIVPHSFLAHTSSPTHAGWRQIPSTYIHTENDMALDINYQRKMVRDAKAAGADVTEVSFDTGHSPWVVDEEGIVKVIEEAAKSVV